MKHTRQYTWEGVQEGVNSIAMQLFKDEWRPDYIVGITRGGLVPAVLLSHATDIPMKTLCVQLESDGLEANTERNAQMARDALKNNKKILIIDDINDTGKTLSWIREDWVASMGGASYDASAWGDTVRTACLIDNQASGFDGMDYTALEINKMEEDVWVVFPWEGERDYGNF